MVPPLAVEAVESLMRQSSPGDDDTHHVLIPQSRQTMRCTPALRANRQTTLRRLSGEAVWLFARIAQGSRRCAADRDH